MKCIDDFSKPIKDNIIKPFKTPSFSQCHHDLISAAKTKININKAWNELSKKEKDWIIFGDKHFESFDSSPNKWYGLKGFFTWLEKKLIKLILEFYSPGIESMKDALLVMVVD